MKALGDQRSFFDVEFPEMLARIMCVNTQIISKDVFFWYAAIKRILGDIIYLVVMTVVARYEKPFNFPRIIQKNSSFYSFSSGIA